MKTIGEVLDYVTLHYFDPPIDELHPYEYAVKLGLGTPFLIARHTTLGKLKRHQKERRVGLDHIWIVGKANLSKQFLKSFLSNASAIFDVLSTCYSANCW